MGLRHRWILATFRPHDRMERSNSCRDLESCKNGKGALAVIEGQETAGSKMHGGGDVEDIEGAVASRGGRFPR